MRFSQKNVADAYQENNVVKLQSILASSEALAEKFLRRRTIGLIQLLLEQYCLPAVQIFRLARKI